MSGSRSLPKSGIAVLPAPTFAASIAWGSGSPVAFTRSTCRFTWLKTPFLGTQAKPWHIAIVAKAAGDHAILVRSTLKIFVASFAELEKDVLPGDIMASQDSLENSLRGGSRSIQLTTMGMSIAGFPSAPTLTEIAQFNEIAAMIDASVQILNHLIIVEIPKLNNVLEHNGFKRFPDIPEIKL